MKFYYIDETLLERDEKATSMRNRFENWTKQHPADFILVSSFYKNQKNIESFRQEMEPIEVFVSPMKIDIQGVRGVLHDTCLRMEGFAETQTHSGSFVYYDSEEQHCERIYLEFHPQHDVGDNVQFVEELEEMLNEKLHMLLKKKKSIMN